MNLQLIDGMQWICRDRHGRELVGVCRLDAHSFGAGTTLRLDAGFFFVQMLSGSASVAGGDGAESLLRRNDLLVLTPSYGVLLEPRSTDVLMQCLYFLPRYFDSLPDSQPLYERLAGMFHYRTLPILHLDEQHGDYLHQTSLLFSTLLGQFSLQGEELVRHASSFYLLQVANACRRREDVAGRSGRHLFELYRRFKKLLVAHFRTEHRIAFYAERLNISTTYLSRVVKQVTGRTVHTHVAELLCAEARRLLEGTDCNVKEIAGQLGFADQSAFGKFYVKQTGCSPVRSRLRKTSAGNVVVK